MCSPFTPPKLAPNNLEENEGFDFCTFKTWLKACSLIFVCRTPLWPVCVSCCKMDLTPFPENLDSFLSSRVGPALLGRNHITLSVTWWSRRLMWGKDKKILGMIWRYSSIADLLLRFGVDSVVGILDKCFVQYYHIVMIIRTFFMFPVLLCTFIRNIYSTVHA